MDRAKTLQAAPQACLVVKSEVLDHEGLGGELKSKRETQICSVKRRKAMCARLSRLPPSFRVRLRWPPLKSTAGAWS